MDPTAEGHVLMMEEPRTHEPKMVDIEAKVLTMWVHPAMTVARKSEAYAPYAYCEMYYLFC